MNPSDNKPRRYWLYVLRLEQEKYYIGVTSKTPEERFKEHQKGIRSANWTRKYKPVELIDSQDLGVMTYADAQVYEDKVIRAYLKKVGVNNARGGDLKDVDDYIIRFGYIFDVWGWETITLVVFLLLWGTVATVAYFLK
jgi:predicted GIY-YIG superfamily endonuclease